jgi:hypothetical protein
LIARESSCCHSNVRGGISFHQPLRILFTEHTIMRRNVYNVAYLLVVAILSPVQASITIMETGKIFTSRPETTLGHQLWKGSDYMGRLQFVHGNLQLCKSAQEPSRQFVITEPLDGLPGEFFHTSFSLLLHPLPIFVSHFPWS